MTNLPDPEENLTDREEDLFRTATGDDWVMPPVEPQPVTDASQPVPVAQVPQAVPVVKLPAAPRPSFLDRRVAGKLRARRVRRLVRHVEPWSVLKLSLIFYFCLWGIMLIAGVILWSLAVGSGTIDNVENFIQKLFALDSFAFNADQIFRASAVGGLVLVVAGAGFTVLMAVLFNLISDVTGGIRFTVVEEETARPRPKRIRPRPGVLRRVVAPQPQQPQQPQVPSDGPPDVDQEMTFDDELSESIPMPDDFIGDADPEVATNSEDR